MKDNHDMVSKVKAYIDSHLSEELNLNQLAAIAGYSKFHMCRSFRENAGITIHQYVKRHRLAEAARLLAQTNIPISEIAAANGYEYQQSFHQAFKELYMETPLAYRRRYQYQALQVNIKNKHMHKLSGQGRLQKMKGELVA